MLKDEGIIRHRGKIEAAIRGARAWKGSWRPTTAVSRLHLEIRRRPPGPEHLASMREVPAETDMSRALSRALKEEDLIRGPAIRLRLRAGRGHGQRPRDGLFPPPRLRKDVAEKRQKALHARHDLKPRTRLGQIPTLSIGSAEYRRNRRKQK
jgi:hypothetical protein